MSRRVKGDGTDAYGQMTNATLRRKLAEAHAELRDHRNAEHQRTHEQRQQLEVAKAEVERLAEENRVYRKIAEGALDELARVEAEIARVRAARPLGTVLEAKARRLW